MKYLLMQSDDFGITEGVCAGAVKAITEGAIRNTGIFINMEHATKCMEKAKDLDVCLGIDINVVAGRPVSNPADVPHLIDENGLFKTSRYQMKTHKVKEVDGFIIVFDEDPYPYEEVLLETENQVKRFIELAGKKPGYLHGHSLCTPNLYKAMDTVAKKYDITFTIDVFSNEKYHMPAEGDYLNKNRSLEEQINLSKKERFIKEVLPSIKDGETWIYIIHCGFIDYDLFKQSSLTLERMMDLDLATDKEVLQYIKENDIKLITYADLV